jgi:hypothetical protein
VEGARWSGLQIIPVENIIIIKRLKKCKTIKN